MLDELPEVPTPIAAFPDRSSSACSVSLSVADLDAPRAFYEALGFEVTGGDADAGYLILRNGEAMIGLFHGCSRATS
ncbi:MAG: hypothetical protein R2695_19800 [Acidimicrobiales bacterium]